LTGKRVQDGFSAGPQPTAHSPQPTLLPIPAEPVTDRIPRTLVSLEPSLSPKMRKRVTHICCRRFSLVPGYSYFFSGIRAPEMPLCEEPLPISFLFVHCFFPEGFSCRNGGEGPGRCSLHIPEASPQSYSAAATSCSSCPLTRARALGFAGMNMVTPRMHISREKADVKKDVNEIIIT